MKKHTRSMAIFLSCAALLMGTSSVNAENIETSYATQEMNVGDFESSNDEEVISQEIIDDLSLEEYLEQNPVMLQSDTDTLSLGDYIAQTTAILSENMWEQNLTEFLNSHTEAEYVINDLTLEQHIELYGDIAIMVSDGWTQDSTGWKYYVNGSAITGWKQIGGTWYYFGSNTYMVYSAWRKIGGHWYYFESSGAMVTGWKKLGGYWYYFRVTGSTQYPLGSMVSGNATIGSSFYYFRDTSESASDYGSMFQGFYPSLSAPTYYYGYPGNADAGARYTAGWLHEGSNWYYTKNDTGVLYFGLCSISKNVNNRMETSKFYFNSTSKAMVTGNFSYAGSTYYAEPNSSSNYFGAVHEAVYDVVTDDLGTDNNRIVQDHFPYLQSMGYYTTLNSFQTPKQFFDDLPTRKVAIVHGHGSDTGYICFDNGSGNHASNGRLYNYTASLSGSDARISDYYTGELSFMDLVIYTSCFSAKQDSLSVAGRTHTKGAQTVVGYKTSVTRGEWFSLYLVYYVDQNPNDSFDVCIEKARNYFDAHWLEMQINETRPSNAETNLRVYEN